MFKASVWVVPFVLFAGAGQAGQKINRAANNKTSLSFEEELAEKFERAGVLREEKLTERGQDLFFQTKNELRNAFRKARTFFEDPTHLAPYSPAAQHIIGLTFNLASNISTWKIVMSDEDASVWSVADIDNLFGVHTGLLNFAEVVNLTVYRANGTIDKDDLIAVNEKSFTKRDRDEMKRDIDQIFSSARDNLLGRIWKGFNLVGDFSERRMGCVHPGETSLEEIQSHLRSHKLWEYVLNGRLDIPEKK